MYSFSKPHHSKRVHHRLFNSKSHQRLCPSLLSGQGTSSSSSTIEIPTDSDAAIAEAKKKITEIVAGTVSSGIATIGIALGVVYYNDKLTQIHEITDQYLESIYSSEHEYANLGLKSDSISKLKFDSITVSINAELLAKVPHYKGVTLVRDFIQTVKQFFIKNGTTFLDSFGRVAFPVADVAINVAGNAIKMAKFSNDLQLVKDEFFANHGNEMPTSLVEISSIQISKANETSFEHLAVDGVSAIMDWKAGRTSGKWAAARIVGNTGYVLGYKAVTASLNAIWDVLTELVPSGDLRSQTEIIKDMGIPEDSMLNGNQSEVVSAINKSVTPPRSNPPLPAGPPPFSFIDPAKETNFDKDMTSKEGVEIAKEWDTTCHNAELAITRLETRARQVFLNNPNALSIDSWKSRSDFKNQIAELKRTFLIDRWDIRNPDTNKIKTVQEVIDKKGKQIRGMFNELWGTSHSDAIMKPLQSELKSIDEQLTKESRLIPKHGQPSVFIERGRVVGVIGHGLGVKRQYTEKHNKSKRQKTTLGKGWTDFVEDVADQAGNVVVDAGKDLVNIAAPVKDTEAGKVVVGAITDSANNTAKTGQDAANSEAGQVVIGTTTDAAKDVAKTDEGKFLIENATNAGTVIGNNSPDLGKKLKNGLDVAGEWVYDNGKYVFTNHRVWHPPHKPDIAAFKKSQRDRIRENFWIEHERRPTTEEIDKLVAQQLIDDNHSMRIFLFMLQDVHPDKYKQFLIDYKRLKYGYWTTENVFDMALSSLKESIRSMPGGVTAFFKYASLAVSVLASTALMLLLGPVGAAIGFAVLMVAQTILTPMLEEYLGPMIDVDEDETKFVKPILQEGLDDLNVQDDDSAIKYHDDPITPDTPDTK